MAKLIYSAITSLDGYVEDARGGFDWAAPDDEVHAFVNDLERPVGTYLYGRRMYETMVFWETAGAGAELREVSRDFAQIWQAAEKVVYSRTLRVVSSARTRIERELDPEAIRRLKESSQADITIGGAELAGQAIARGAGRRVPPVPQPGRRRWRQAGTAGRLRRAARAARRTPLRRRGRAPPLPRGRLICASRVRTGPTPGRSLLSDQGSGCYSYRSGNTGGWIPQSGRHRGQQGVTESMVKPCPVTAGSLVICTEPVEVGTQAESNPPGMLPV